MSGSERFHIIDAEGRRIRTMLDAPRGIVLSPDDTFATQEEAVLSLIFCYPSHCTSLRTAPVTDPLPTQPRMLQ